MFVFGFVILSCACVNQYERLLFHAAMLGEFFGFMRVGEFAVDSANRVQESFLRFSNISFSSLGADCGSVLISFRSSKNNQSGSPQVIRLAAARDVGICLVTALRHYVGVRPQGPGVLFCYYSGARPLTRYQFNAILKRALAFCGLREQCTRAHSLRIGAATVAFELGVPFPVIQQMGRWRSNAVLAYIRPVALCALPGISLDG